MSGVLDNVKVGDKLLVTGRWSKEIAAIRKVLKLYIIADGVKYRKLDGLMAPCDTRYPYSARPATEEDIEQVRMGYRRQKILSAIRKINFYDLSDSQLEQILEIANKKEV